MKKAFLGILFFTSLFAFTQEIDFSEVAFKSWNEEEQRTKIFALFDENVPSDEKIHSLLTRLIESGALDVNMRSKSGKRTIFDACLVAGHYKSARLLIEKGYKINQRCFKCNGETPLLKAIYVSGELKEPSDELGELMSFMIEKGADPDLRDMKGYTSVHWAIKNKDAVALKALMKPEVVLNAQLATLKGKGYLVFFDKHWDEDEYREILMEKTGLKYPPTKKEIKAKKKAAKEKQKESKKNKKEKEDQK